jgi:hypothetical protein
MTDLTDNGHQIIAEIASRYGLSLEAVDILGSTSRHRHG